MAFTYAIVDSFSIAFLLILFISTRERSSRLSENRCFRLIVILTALALLCDMMAWQFDGQVGNANHMILWIVNIMCYVLSGAMSLLWLYYVALKMNRINRIKQGSWAVISIPCLFLIAVSLLSPWTHWLFYIDELNLYHRSSLFVLQIIIPIGYILGAGIWSFARSRTERSSQTRLEYLYLSTFIIFPLIGALLQLTIYGVSLTWPCTALSLMLVYVGMQNQRISLDALTGLNNRRQFDKHLYNCFKRAETDFEFALYMLDIDEFKKINDTLGHTAGDAALVDAAALLRKALSGSNAFLARYGGDEFAIVLSNTTHVEAEALASRIAKETEYHNNAGDAPYKLVFSVGYVIFDKNRYLNYRDMITAADAHMYAEKRKHKSLYRDGGSGSKVV